MITQLLIVLALLFGGPGLPIQIERVSASEIAYRFGHARYVGGCTPHVGSAYAQRIEFAGQHVFTTVRSGDCAVAILD